MLVATSLLDTHFLSHASDFSTPALVRVRFLINPHVGFASCCVFRTTFCWYSRFAFSLEGNFSWHWLHTGKGVYQTLFHANRVKL